MSHFKVKSDTFLVKFNFWFLFLQVLLSQVHRVRALDLLGCFLDLGGWAVNLALSVGIFPYVLKLLQSTARELRPLLVFIWAKILAVDSVSIKAFLLSQSELLIHIILSILSFNMSVQGVCKF